MSSNGRIVILGFGAMGRSLAQGWLRKKLFPSSGIWAADLDEKKLTTAKKEMKIKVGPTVEALPKASLVLLSVKPQNVKALLSEIGYLIPSRALVISIAAGVATSQIEKSLPQGCPVVRVMPNTPSQLGAGMAAVAHGSRSQPAHLKTVLKLFKAVGRVVEVNENLMDLVTALSGSGPAYFYLFLETLADAGTKGGLSPAIALELAVQTAIGAARMVQETGMSPADLRAQVSSPGGTTLAGLQVLEDRGFKDIVREAVKAATLRALELRKMNE